MATKATSVTALNERLRGFIERELGDKTFTIGGYATDFRDYSRKHVYFTLCDGSNEIFSMIPRHVASQVGFIHPCSFVQGTVNIKFYPPAGKLEVYFHDLEVLSARPSDARFSELVSILEGEGLLPSPRRPIPLPPAHIGLITSEGSAARGDFDSTMRDRGAKAKVIFRHAQVVGPGTIESIEQAMASFKPGEVDVLVITRGGGDDEDFMPFKSLPLARAIARSEIPTVVAVGHEKDKTLAGMVADWQLSTPTAAAIFLSEEGRGAALVVEPAVSGEGLEMPGQEASGGPSTSLQIAELVVWGLVVIVVVGLVLMYVLR